MAFVCADCSRDLSAPRRSQSRTRDRLISTIITSSMFSSSGFFRRRLIKLRETTPSDLYLP